MKKLLKNNKEYEITNISFQEYEDFSNIDDLEKINLNNFFLFKRKNWLNWKYNIL